jgi:predicted lipoprotein with Yx(FWY)xxD motif
MQQKLILAAMFTFALAACGGGGGGGYGGSNPVPNPTTPSSGGGSNGNIPQIASVAGSNAFVSSSNQHTLYYLTSDNATGGGCTGSGGCTSVWPPYMASAGAAGVNNMQVITRSDGTGQQWAFQGHPLYMYAGDSGSLQSNGEGIVSFGGTWHVSRPASSGGGGGGGGGGGY